MPCKFLLATPSRIVTMLLILAAVSVQAVEVNYAYQGDPGIDFSELGADALLVGPFSDGRDVTSPQQITADVSAESALTDIIQSAFEQAFIAGKAKLANDSSAQRSAKFQFSGELIELSTEQEADSIKLTLRVQAALKQTATNKTLWQNKLFSRVSVSQQDGIDGAVRSALDRLIEELMFDDYFLNELLG